MTNIIFFLSFNRQLVQRNNSYTNEKDKSGFQLCGVSPVFWIGNIGGIQVREPIENCLLDRYRYRISFCGQFEKSVERSHFEAS